jgi:hypothetical protein
MGVGVGLILLIFWSSWAGPGYFAGDGRRGRRRVVEEDV